MVSIGLIVPVLSNFKGLAQLMASVDMPVTPYILDNWNENRGVAASWNEGIKRARRNGEDVVIIVNDDVTFHPDTIRRLANTVRYYHMDLISAVATDTGLTGIHEQGFPDFCCFALNPVDFPNRFGKFDERFFPAYFEDNDMSYRVKLGGGRQGLLLDARIDHVGSVTNRKGRTDDEDRVVSHEQFRTNNKYYQTKWGGNPGGEKYTAPFNGVTGKTFKD